MFKILGMLVVEVSSNVYFGVWRLDLGGEVEFFLTGYLLSDAGAILTIISFIWLIMTKGHWTESGRSNNSNSVIPNGSLLTSRFGLVEVATRCIFESLKCPLCMG